MTLNFKCNSPISVLFLFILNFENATASLGDSFPSYKYCVKSCKDGFCDEGMWIM